MKPMPIPAKEAGVPKCRRRRSSAMQRAGYTCLCITDHFLNGNTTVPSCGSWESRIDQFCAGYERAAEAGAKLGLSVFFGWEFSHAGTDFLTYGLDKAWLLRHPDCHTLRVPEYSALVHESGGFLVQAHPFREDWYIETIRLSPRDVDAVEVVNACRTAFENENADWYASRYALLKTAGSDIHRPLTQRAGLCTEKEASFVRHADGKRCRPEPRRFSPKQTRCNRARKRFCDGTQFGVLSAMCRILLAFKKWVCEIRVPSIGTAAFGGSFAFLHPSGMQKHLWKAKTGRKTVRKDGLDAKLYRRYRQFGFPKRSGKKQDGLAMPSKRERTVRNGKKEKGVPSCKSSNQESIFQSGSD